MKTKTTAVLVGISLGGVALGQGTMGTQQQHPSSPQSPSGMQQPSGSMGQQPSGMGSTAMGEKQISGKVLGMKERTLYLESSEGFAVPVTVTKETMMDGKRVERDLKKEIKPGEEVRASFTVKQKGDGAAENVATTIEKANR